MHFKHWRRAPQSTPDACETAPRHTMEGRVLVVEDNEINAKIVIDMLSAAGYETVRAHDGSEAVRLFAASAPYAYTAILMDCQMPVMDGYDATRAIRAMDRLDSAQVRIVACTSNTGEDDRRQAALCGMDAFVPKPVEREVLLHALHSGEGSEGEA